MNSIKLVTLKGCPMCKELIEELEKRDVRYKIIDADGNASFCDRLEDSLGVYNYPIAIVENNGYIHYYHIATTYDELKVTKLSLRGYLHGCRSVVDMINNILN